MPKNRAEMTSNLNSNSKSMRPEALLEQLSRVDKDTQFVIVLKTRKALITSMKFCRDPGRSQCFLILVASDKVLRVITDEQRGAFQMILPFSLVGDEKKSQCWSDMTVVSYEMVPPLLEKLMSFLPPSRTTLTVSEEVIMYFAASLRQRFRIPGLDCSTVMRFTDKLAMKNVCLQNSIPCARYFALAPDDVDSVDQLCVEMAKHSLRFPVFIKPRRSCGSFDAVRIVNRKALSDWLRSHADGSPYLCEEFVDGTEMAAYLIVQNNSVRRLRIFRNAGPILRFVELQEPLGKLELKLKSKPFQASANFVMAVARAFSPLQNGVFAVEFFEKSDGSFVFSENCARLPGGSFTDIMQVTEHFNVEAFHLTAGLCFDAMANCRQPHVYSAYIRYPTRSGTVVKRNDFPEQIKSQLQPSWRVQVGQKLETPTELSGKYEVLKLNMYNTNHEELKADFEMLFNSYSPCVVSD